MGQSLEDTRRHRSRHWSFVFFRLSLAFFLGERLHASLESLHLNPHLALAIKYGFVIPLALIIAYAIKLRKIIDFLLLISAYLAFCHLLAYGIVKYSEPHAVSLDYAIAKGFFGRTDKDFKFWYYLNPKGDYELFRSLEDQPVHPLYGDPLKPITPPVAKVIIKKYQSPHVDDKQQPGWIQTAIEEIKKELQR